MSRSRKSIVSATLALFLLSETHVAEARDLFQRDDAALNYCEAERTPIVDREKEYAELRRSRLGAALTEGLKRGAIVFATGLLSNTVGNLTGGQFGGNGQAAQAGSNSMVTQDTLNAALALKVSGVTTAASQNDQIKAWAVLAVVVAVAGTVDAFVKLKEEEAGGDLRKASTSIDQDAGRQLAVTREFASEVSNLADCRQRQIASLNDRLARASNDKDRKAISRERSKIASALDKDIDATDGVLKEQTGLAKTFTQGRAMTQGVSEADVLGGQAPAYEGTDLTEKRAMPVDDPKSGGEASKLVTLRPTAVRSSPSTSSAIVVNFPAGRDVQPKKRADADSGWWEIDIAGEPGFIRGADLGEPGSVVKTASKGKKKPSKPPPLAPATNIRAHNQSIIATREQGKGRLQSLLTDIKAG